MKMQPVRILPFQPVHQADVDELMAAIELEFEEPVSGEGSGSRPLNEAAASPDVQAWVAVQDSKAVGTLAVKLLANRAAVLFRVFLAKNQRGSGISQELLAAGLGWAAEHSVRDVYLGTMTQFQAAQRFYAKHGFRPIPATELPADFPRNPVDAEFFQRRLERD